MNNEPLRSGSFPFTVTDPYYILDLINEARATRGEEPLTIEDIAVRIPDRRNLSIRNLR